MKIANGQQKNRVDYIDIFKGFGIILMVRGHINFGGRFDYFIHAFHMPMFFWISGYLYGDKKENELNLRQFIIKRATSLLIPYLIFGVAHYLLWLSLYEFSINPLLHLISYNTTGLPIAGGLWFLTALFFTEILFFFINRYVKKAALKVMVITGLSLLGNVSVMLFAKDLPFALSASLVGLGLYYVGYLMKTNSEKTVLHKLLNLTWFEIFLGADIVVISIFTNGYINMREGTYAIIPLFWINAILSILIGFNISKRIAAFTESVKNRVVVFWKNWVISVGKNSIVYLCMNQVVIMIVEKYISYISISTVVDQAVILVLVLFILTLCSEIITNTRLRFLIGK